MRIAVTALGAALVLLAVGACSSSNGASGGGSTSSTLVVGEFNPFSGPDAAFGPEMGGGCVPVDLLQRSRTIEQQFDIAANMVDARFGYLGAILDFRQNIRALQHGLNVKRKALRRP